MHGGRLQVTEVAQMRVNTSKFRPKTVHCPIERKEKDVQVSQGLVYE